MKYLILSIFPAAMQYKGHARALSHIANEVARFNGSVYGNPDGRTSEETDKSIRRIINEADSNIEIEQVNETTVKFGHNKTDKYVEYGSIIKTVLL